MAAAAGQGGRPAGALASASRSAGRTGEGPSCRRRRLGARSRALAGRRKAVVRRTRRTGTAGAAGGTTLGRGRDVGIGGAPPARGRNPRYYLGEHSDVSGNAGQQLGLDACARCRHASPTPAPRCQGAPAESPHPPIGSHPPPQTCGTQATPAARRCQRTVVATASTSRTPVQWPQPHADSRPSSADLRRSSLAGLARGPNLVSALSSTERCPANKAVDTVRRGVRHLDGFVWVARWLDDDHVIRFGECLGRRDFEAEVSVWFEVQPLDAF